MKKRRKDTKPAKVRPDAQLAALSALLDPERDKKRDKKPDREEILARHGLKV